MTEVVDPYLDPDTGLLHNLVGATTKSALDAAEADLVWPRAIQLSEHPLPATGDLNEFRTIHQHLFQDVYSWAGETRTVDIRKNADRASFFLPVSMIERSSNFAADRVAADAGWRLDWTPVQGAVNDDACRAASEDGNLIPLMEMFAHVVQQ